MEKITIIGGGSWGSAIANSLAEKGEDACLYIMEKQQYDLVVKTKTNPQYLKDFTFSNHLKFSNDFNKSVEEATVLIIAVPTNAVRSVLEQIKKLNVSPRTLVNLAKGLEQNTHLRISEIANEILPEFPFVALNGPSHAEEVAKNLPTTLVACSENHSEAVKIEKLFSTETLRIYYQDDLVGVEMGAALKNIIALAAGLTDGLQFGDNTKAALMTRGIHEITKLGIQMGAKPQTFLGLTGIGDLIVTCTSLHSRNRNFGYLIGQGKSVEEAMKIVDMVVEGYKTTKSAYELSQEVGVEMPITEKLYDVLYKGEDPKIAVMELMTRRSKHENEGINDIS